MEVFCYVVADVWKCMYIDTFFSVLRWGDSPRKPSLTWTCHMCSGRVEADSEALAWKRVSQIPTGGIFGACRRCLWSEVRVRLTLTRKEAHPYFEAISGSPFTCSLTWSSIQSNMDELHSLQAGPWDDSDEFTSCSGSHTCPIFSAFDLDLIVFPSDFFLQIFEKKLKLTRDTALLWTRCVWADSDNSAIYCWIWSCPVFVGETDGNKTPESAITDNLHCCLLRLLIVLVDV